MRTNIYDIVVFEKLLIWHDTFWKYLTPDFNTYLNIYLQSFERYRIETNCYTTNKQDWLALPFGSYANNSSWKWRRESLTLLKSLIKNETYNTTIEIGCWNGWLTKYLAKQSKTVIACDYFVCPYDGVSNIKDLDANIIAVQCNLEDISKTFKPERFDLIVLNHNLAYTKNPVEYIKNLIPLLKPDGKIISLGNTIYKNPANKVEINFKNQIEYKEKHNQDLYISPVKGYLDLEDLRTLKELNFKIKGYKNKKSQNMYSKLNTKSPYYCHITYNNRESTDDIKS